MISCFMASCIGEAWEFVYGMSAVDAVISSTSHFSQCKLLSTMVHHGAICLEQSAFLYDAYVKYRSATKCQQ
jgi:hypothetical protein